jgi:hypothetical protein
LHGYGKGRPAPAFFVGLTRGAMEASSAGGWFDAAPSADGMLRWLTVPKK